MEYQYLLVEKKTGYAVITLNRPKANALSCELIKELGSAVHELENDAAVASILITATGKFFSAGADVPTIQKTLPDPFAEGTLLTEGLKTIDIIETCTKPVIAAINGVAVGGGCEMILACDIRIAADTACFGQPEINIGIVPGWGGAHRLPRLIGESRAVEWMLTGRMVSAQEALEAGLVCKVVPAAELPEAAAQLAQSLAQKPRVAVRGILRAVHERALHPDRGKAVEAESFSEAALTKDAAEGVAAFLEKRAPNFIGQ